MITVPELAPFSPHLRTVVDRLKHLVGSRGLCSGASLGLTGSFRLKAFPHDSHLNF